VVLKELEVLDVMLRDALLYIVGVQVEELIVMETNKVEGRVLFAPGAPYCLRNGESLLNCVQVLWLDVGEA